MPEPRNRKKPETGESERRRGRPRKATGMSDGSAFEVLADKRIPYVFDGRRELLTPLEALEQQTFQSAWDGKPSAIADILPMIAANERARLPETRGIPRIRFEHPPARIDDVLTLLRLATSTHVPQNWEKQYDRTLQLDSGAVSFALRSGQSLRLTADQLSHIRKRTKDADKVNWPDIDKDD